MKKTAFIGAGNMAEAMVRGLLASGGFKKTDLTLSDTDPERLSFMSSQYGVATTSDNAEAVRNSDIVVFSVKPGVIPEVLREVKNIVTKDKLYVSIAAGVGYSFIRRLVGRR